MPADKLVVREVHNLKMDSPKRGALRIAKLKHAGDWNIAPQAIPNLMDALRKPPFSFDVVLTQKDLSPRDPNLIYYPLIYIHGRGAISFPEGRPRGAAAAPRARRRDAVRRRGLRQPRLRRRVPPVRRRAPARATGWSRSRRRTSCTRRRSDSTSQSASTPRPPAAGTASRSSRASRSTATGPSSTPSSTSAARWNGTRGSTARDTPTRAPSGSPAIS